MKCLKVVRRIINLRVRKGLLTIELRFEIHDTILMLRSLGEES